MNFLQSLADKARKVADATYHGLNPLDNGQGWTSRAPSNPTSSPLLIRLQGAVAQVNPLDSGRTYNTVLQHGANFTPHVNQSGINQLTHGGIPNAVGSFVNNITGIPSAIDAARLGVAELTHNQPAIDRSTTSLAKNLPRFVPIALAEGTKGLGQNLATAVTSPINEIYTNREASRAVKELSPVYGQNNAEIEGGRIKQGMLNQQLATSGIDQDTPTSTVARKVGGNAGNAAASIIFASQIGNPLATKYFPGSMPALVKQAESSLLKKAVTSGATNAAANLAGVAAGDNPHALDYLKAGGLGFAQGAAFPVAEAVPGLVSGRAHTPIEIADRNKWVATYNEALAKNKPGIADHAATKIAEIDQLTKSPISQAVDKRIPKVRADGEFPLGKTPLDPEELPSNAHTPLQSTDKISSNAALKGAQPADIKLQIPIIAGKSGPELSRLAQTAEQLQREQNALPNSNTPGNKKQFNATKYVDEQTQLQKKALGDKPNILSRFRKEFATKGIDALSPIEKPITDAVGGKANALPLRNALDRSLRSDTIAGQYVKDNGLAQVIKTAPDTKALDQYMIAKHAVDLEANGIKTGRNLAKDAQLVKELSPQYEAHAQALQQYNHGLLDKTVEYGLISKETGAYLKQKYPNYVPFDRIFADGELQGATGNGAGPASLSKQTVMQRIKGSERQIASPLESILAKTHDVIAQGERSNAARAIVETADLPGNPLGIVPLRTEANVNARFEAYKGLAELKPVKDALQKEATTTAKQLRELVSRNKELGPKILSKIKSSADEVRANAIKEANGGARAVNRPDSKRLSNTVNEAHVHEAFQQYLDGNPKLVQNMFEFMGNKKEVGRIQNKLDGLKAQFDQVKQDRGALYDEAKLHSDAASRGKATISTFKNGVKEIYETTPEVAQAAKSLNKQQLGLVGKILSYPTRALRLGATGVNVGFAGANVVKDVASSFINSKHPFESSIANPKVFVEALSAAFHHGGKAYGELVREGAGGTSFDIGRNAAPETINRIRSNKSAGSKALYVARHPGELLRAVEDTIGRSEEFGRALQYYGNKNAALKAGKSVGEATAYGADAARNNTVNFARAGEYGRVLNSVLPYFNAGIQGSRTLLVNLKEHPVQTGAKIAISAFVPVATTTAWNLSDPKRKEAYDDIQEYEKKGNIIIVPPNPHKDANGRWNVIKIPVSQEVANLNNTVRNGVEAMYKDKGFDFRSMAGDLTGTVTSVNMGSKRELANQVTPQAIKPVIEDLTNQNLFTGNKIVPDKMQNLDPRDQVGKNTSGTFKFIGNATNTSPLKLDNALRTTLGGAGQNILNLSDSALAKLGVIKPDDVKGRSFSQSITNRFTSAQGQSEYAPIDKALADAFTKLKSTDGYKSMSSNDKAKALSRLQNDVVASTKQQIDAKNGTGQYAPDFTGKESKLSKRQAGLLDGKTDVSSYLTTRASKTSYPSGMNNYDIQTLERFTKKTPAEKNAIFSKEKDAEYKLALANYEKKKHEGSLTETQAIKDQQALAKAKIGSNYDKQVRDLYTLSKQQAYDYLTKASNGQALANQLIAYDNELKANGLSQYAKYTTSKGVVSIAPVKKSGGRKTASVRKTGAKGGKKQLGRKTYTSPLASFIKTTGTLNRRVANAKVGKFNLQRKVRLA